MAPPPSAARASQPQASLRLSLLCPISLERLERPARPLEYERSEGMLGKLLQFVVLEALDVESGRTRTRCLLGGWARPVQKGRGGTSVECPAALLEARGRRCRHLRCFGLAAYCRPRKALVGRRSVLLAIGFLDDALGRSNHGVARSLRSRAPVTMVSQMHLKSLRGSSWGSSLG